MRLLKLYAETLFHVGLVAGNLFGLAAMIGNEVVGWRAVLCLAVIWMSTGCAVGAGYRFYLELDSDLESEEL